VEFARQKQEEGVASAEAAVHAARTRLRPILMTSLSFILGVAPLAVATGAGAEMRQSLGTAVLFGMLGVTCFGLDGADRRRIETTRDAVRFEAGGMEIDLLAARRRLMGDLAKLPIEALEQTAAAFRGEFAEGLELAKCPDFEAWRVAEREDARRLRARLL